jgi:taurine---2-oxoglutarate transaminase
MVCDEVMAGFGRSGKLFGFCHAPTVVPDVVTFAKGVNGATLPLGGVGVRDFLADHFRKNAISIGSTYNGHPVALASALASIQELLSRDLINHAAAMEEHMKKGLQRLLNNHPRYT